jgi:hypothetical protein
VETAVPFLTGLIINLTHLAVFLWKKIPHQELSWARVAELKGNTTLEEQNHVSLNQWYSFELMGTTLYLIRAVDAALTNAPGPVWLSLLSLCAGVWAFVQRAAQRGGSILFIFDCSSPSKN